MSQVWKFGWIVMDKQGHEKAADALVAISTLSREAAYEDIKKLVRTLLQCPLKRNNLPVLIMLMRNHSKSLAPGRRFLRSVPDCHHLREVCRGLPASESNELRPVGQHTQLPRP